MGRRVRLHRVYKAEAFPEPILDLTLRFIKEKPWSKAVDNRHLFEVWLHGACLVYEVPCPVLVKTPHHGDRSRPTYGEYKKAEGTPENMFGVIVLRKWSVISLLHQFRHHMQANSDLLPKETYNSSAEQGEDAQAWACSLFYNVAPRRFRRMARAGRVVGVTPEDLLKRKAAA